VANDNEKNRVYLGDGSGGFSTSPASSDSNSSYGVALGDLDGDGNLDAFVANDGGGANRVYLGDGCRRPE